MYVPMVWIARAGEIAGALLAIAGLAALIRSKVVRPLIAGWNRAVNILEQLLTTARFAKEVAAEMREFSGAFTLFAVGIREQVDRNTDRLDRLEEMRELIVDLQADVARINRRHNHGRREGEHE